MAKSSSSRSSAKSTTKSAANKSTNRPKPMVPKAGYTQSRRRYGEGGKSY